MKNLKLNPDSLIVASFETDPLASPEEQVFADDTIMCPTPATRCRICPPYTTETEENPL